MTRLVTFGCSYTYGHGLPDCYDGKHAGPNPSLYAWPAKLADMLNVEVVNNSNPGSSNIQMLWKLLNFDFKKSDICVVMWSHFFRHPYSVLSSDSSKIQTLDYSDKVIVTQTDEENVVIRNFITIHHAFSYLQTKQIKHYFVIGPHDSACYTSPIEIPTLHTDISLINHMVDHALDKKHPGLQTNANIAKLLYNKINELH